LSGIPKGETTIASLAGGGTLSLEMELLGRLTGNKEYGKSAKLATRALWMRRSSANLLGKHIDTKSGDWTETLSGIGSNSDSFYEYLIKHHVLFPEDDDFWPQLLAVYDGVHKESRLGGTYILLFKLQHSFIE
jgi:mannosidase alpha-like ER degradation enhancer 2